MWRALNWLLGGWSEGLSPAEQALADLRERAAHIEALAYLRGLIPREPDPDGDNDDDAAHD